MSVKTQPKQNHHLHGDIGLIPSPNTRCPKAKDVEVKKLHILQSSGVTGNRHEIFHKIEPIRRWHTADGKQYVSCAKPFVLQHIGGDSEHGVQQVKAGTYEVRHEQEHNPWTQELRQVID